MLVAVAAFVIFFIISDRTIFLYVGGVAVVLRLFQYVAFASYSSAARIEKGEAPLPPHPHIDVYKRQILLHLLIVFLYAGTLMLHTDFSLRLSRIRYTKIRI